MERLNKYLALSGICSRRKADQEIEKGNVMVNDQVVTTLGYMVNKNDTVKYLGKIVSIEEKEYYLLNKPRGVITSCKDEKSRKTVIDLFKEQGIKTRLFPAGRLDSDTAGLLVITNDGDFANIIAHPKSEITKEYLVRVEGLVPKNQVILLNKKRYVIYENIKYSLLKLNLIETNKELNSTTLEITVNEGKNHHVKNLFLGLGYKVLTLTRTKIGELNITSVSRGEFRKLKIHEIKQIYSKKKN